MSLTGVNTTTSAATQPSATSSSPTSPAANEQTFLKLLMAQMQNQDPLNPTDSTQFVTQLSQFSLVEQAVNQTTQLTQLSQQLTGISNSDASGLLGKTVTVSNGGNSVNFDGVTATSTNVTLGSAAASVQVAVTDGNGNVVRTIHLGPTPAGALNVIWDGRGDQGQTEPAGTYSLQVSATGSNGSSVAVSQYTTGQVTRVSYDKGYADLFLNNGIDSSIANLVSVGPNNNQ